MFKLLKKENNIQTEVTSFLQQEKKRRKKAEEFIQMLNEVIPYVAEEVWGMSKDDLIIGGNVVFQLKEKKFYLLEESNDNDIVEEVSNLKGHLFWRSVQEIMCYTKDLLLDIQERDEGRNQLIQNMNEIAIQLKESNIVGSKMKPIRY
jgi:hypothetical protein